MKLDLQAIGTRILMHDPFSVFTYIKKDGREIKKELDGYIHIAICIGR